MKLGIQLYSVKENMQKDPIETIKKVSSLGYKNLEVANYNALNDPGIGFGVSAKDVSKVLNDTGAKIVSAHIIPMELETILPVLEYHKEIGTEFIALPMGFYADKNDALRLAEKLNKIGEKCKEYGIELLYHNHYHEFQMFDGETIYDTILKNTDSDLLKIELDTYWAMRAGNDPATLLKTLGKRVRLIHQKDYPKGMEDKINLIDAINSSNQVVGIEEFMKSVDPLAFTEIGTGIMDIQSIIDSANTNCDVAYMILEQDNSQNEEMESIKISMNEFKKFNNIVF